jgi:cysteine desulfurase
MNRVYFDNAGTTSVRAEVLESMSPFFTSYITCENAIKEMNTLKERLKNHLRAFDYELVFTASGSEANNIALACMAHLNNGKEKRLITTTIEHAAIRNTAKKYEAAGYDYKALKVSANGDVDLEALATWCQHDGGFGSMMYVNNETGMILPVKTFVDTMHRYGKVCHTDAVQALGHLKLDLDDLGADFVSFSAHKIHGPKGLGVLLVKKCYYEDCKVVFPVSTDNLPYIVGFEKALSLRYEAMSNHQSHMLNLKQRLLSGLRAISKDIVIISPESEERAVPAINNIMLPFLDGDSVVVMCDLYGIAISSGSACSSGAMTASPVILALGYDEASAKRCIRISMGDFTRLEEVDRIIEVLKNMLEPYLERSDVK